MKNAILELTLGLGLTVLGGLPAPAGQDNNCAPRQVVLDALATKYGETRQSIGLGANNAIVEVFASAETGSWTITVTVPSGLTCLVASGQSYEALTEALPAQGSDA